VKPQIHENYDGGDVVLPGTGAVLSTRQFPFLAKLKGQTLITTMRDRSNWRAVVGWVSLTGSEVVYTLT